MSINYESDIKAATKGQPSYLEKFARDLQKHVTAIASHIGLDLNEHVDGSGPQPAAILQKPPQAKLKIALTGSNWDIQITNPQYISPASMNQLIKAPQQILNKLFATLVHQLQWNTISSFNGVGDSQSFPISAQTHYTPNSAAFGPWFRVRSSFDGFNWNDWSAPQKA